MHKGLQEEVNRIILITVSAVVLGLMSGQVFTCLLLAGFLYSCWLLHQTRKFYLWLEKDEDSYPPNSGGIWSDIFDIIYRSRQRNKKNQQNLQQELDRVQGFTRALQSGVVLIDNQGIINWWNEAAGDMLGFKTGVDEGKPVYNLLRHPRFIKYFQKEDFSELLSLPSPVNPDRTLEFQITVYGNNEKLVVVQDVTRLIRLEQMRKDFVANVSHELRTPLTVINGYLEPISESLESFDQQWQKPINKVYDQALRMTDIVNDLSTLSRLDNEEAMADGEEINIYELLQSIAADAGEVKPEVETKVTVEGEPVVLHGSSTELHSCFSNLIFNAIKYSKPEGVSIHVVISRHEEGVDVAFRDDGIGIDPIHIPRLTERFYRVDKSHSRQTGGTGLGLAIVKHILSRHNAYLSIDSDLGKGSTFTCHFASEQEI